MDVDARDDCSQLGMNVALVTFDVVKRAKIALLQVNAV
jgi:hypothetical protein